MGEGQLRRNALMKGGYSSIAKFKRIEAVLRETTNGYPKVIAEIDKALAAQRKKEEEALLRHVQDECAELFERSRQVLRHLWVGVEGRIAGEYGYSMSCML